MELILNIHLGTVETRYSVLAGEKKDCSQQNKANLKENRPINFSSEIFFVLLHPVVCFSDVISTSSSQSLE